MILGRPFLATIHAKIDVFNKEISLGIEHDRKTDQWFFREKIRKEVEYNTEGPKRRLSQLGSGLRGHSNSYSCGKKVFV
ncbi:hypothetical protein Tco_0665133 [Tanacetum coccineum]